MTSHLSDRRRVELALPSRLLFRCFQAAVDNGGEDAGTDDAQILAWLRESVLAAVSDLDPARTAKIAARCDRVQRNAMAEWEARPLMMAFLVVLYWVRDRTNAGDIVLIEGTPFDLAVTALIPRLETEAGDVWDAMDHSANKGARRLHTAVVDAGYFGD